MRVIKLSNSLGERLARMHRIAVTGFQIGVARDAVSIAGANQHLRAFVFLMARRARDFLVSRNLIGVVLGHSVTGFATLIGDGMNVVTESDQSLQWSPG